MGTIKSVTKKRTHPPVRSFTTLRGPHSRRPPPDDDEDDNDDDDDDAAVAYHGIVKGRRISSLVEGYDYDDNDDGHEYDDSFFLPRN